MPHLTLIFPKGFIQWGNDCISIYCYVTCSFAGHAHVTAAVMPRRLQVMIIKAFPVHKVYVIFLPSFVRHLLYSRGTIMLLLNSQANRYRIICYRFYFSLAELIFIWQSACFNMLPRPYFGVRTINYYRCWAIVW